MNKKITIMTVIFWLSGLTSSMAQYQNKQITWKNKQLNTRNKRIKRNYDKRIDKRIASIHSTASSLVATLKKKVRSSLMWIYSLPTSFYNFTLNTHFISCSKPRVRISSAEIDILFYNKNQQEFKQACEFHQSRPSRVQHIILSSSNKSYMMNDLTYAHFLVLEAIS